MADEFAKGLGILTFAGLGWMTLAGWYRTPSFEGKQLTGAVQVTDPDIYTQIALYMMDALFWFMIIGTLTFWVVIPAIEELRDSLAERSG
jgi:hypothetical protein